MAGLAMGPPRVHGRIVAEQAEQAGPEPIDGARDVPLTISRSPGRLS